VITAHDRVRSAHWFVGSSAPPFYYNLKQDQDGVARYAQGQITVERLEDVQRLVPRLQAELDRAIPQSQTLVRKLSQGPPVDAPVAMRLYGPELDTLRRLGSELRERMARVPEVNHTFATLQAGTPKLELQADEAEVGLAGLGLVTIASQLDRGLGGVPAGSVLEGTEEVPVRTRIARPRRASVSEVASSSVMPPRTGRRPRGPASSEFGALPLGSVGSLKLVPSSGAIPHRNGQRVNVVQAFTDAGTLPSPVLEKVRAELDEDPLDLPSGYRLETGGDVEERSEAIDKLRANAVPLLILMLATVVLTFLSFRLAGVVFVAGVQSVGLGLLSLAVLDYPMGFQAIIGTLGLVGVAVNAAIIILSALQSSPEALRGRTEAVRRVVVGETSRHIVSTTITTFGGFLPLMLSSGGFWPPFATSIAGGVLLSSVLSFYFVPAAFVLLTRRRPVSLSLRATAAVGAIALVSIGPSRTLAQSEETPRPGTEAVVASPDLDARLGRPGRRWSMEQVAARAAKVAPEAAEAEATARAARAREQRRRVDLGPRVRAGARYTRISKIDNDPLVSDLSPPDGVGALVSGVDDPEAQALWQSQLATQRGLSELSIQVPRNQYALYAQARYPITPLFAEILPALRSAEQVSEARRLQAEVAELDAALRATEAYLQHARARGALAVAETGVQRARRDLERAQAKRKAGTGTRPAVLRFRARLADAEREREARRADVQASAEALRALLDLSGSGPVASEEAWTRLPEARIEGDRSELLDRAYERRAEMRALDALVSARKSGVRAARGGAYPELSVAARVDHARPNAQFVPPPDDFRTSWSVSALLEWSPDGAARAAKASSEARAELGEMRQKREALRDGVRIEVTRALARYRAAFDVFEAADRQRRAAQEAYAAQRDSRRAGLATTGDTIEAQLDLQRAELALFDAGVSLRLRAVRLRRALGGPWW
jgi:outer membrane protein TolC